MSGSFSESEHSRDPMGRFTARAGIRNVPDVSLTPTEPRLSIDDPEFAAMTGPLPHLDGAVIEFDDGFRASIGTQTHYVELETGYVPEETECFYRDQRGETYNLITPSNHAYRIVSWDGDEQRLQDELALVHLRNRLGELASAEPDNYADRIANAVLITETSRLIREHLTYVETTYGRRRKDLRYAWAGSLD